MESYERDTLVLFLTYHWPPTGHTNGSLGECKVGWPYGYLTTTKVFFRLKFYPGLVFLDELLREPSKMLGLQALPLPYLTIRLKTGVYLKIY